MVWDMDMQIIHPWAATLTCVVPVFHPKIACALLLVINAIYTFTRTYNNTINTAKKLTTFL